MVCMFRLVRTFALLIVISIVGFIFYNENSSLYTIEGNFLFSLDGEDLHNVTNNGDSLDIEEDLSNVVSFVSSDVVDEGAVVSSNNNSNEIGLKQNNQSVLQLKELNLEDVDISTLQSDNINFLKKVFEKNDDPQVMNSIVQAMLDEYQFVNAKKFIDTLSQKQRSQLDPYLHLQVAFNSFSLSSSTVFTSLEKLVDQYVNSAQLSIEDGNWYYGIISLMQRDYTTFLDIAHHFQIDAYKNFSAKISSLRNQVLQQEDMPLYYLDALIAVELFNQGYFQPSKVLALYASSQNKSYILPYQILAYANFLTNSRDAAIDYLSFLSSLDSVSLEKYNLLMGIAMYWNGQYENSVLKLSQIREKQYLLDVDRYLVLNYSQLHQQTKLLTSRQKLLGH